MKLSAVGIGIRIRQARVARGWTQAQLAKALGVRRSSVVRWETGHCVPSRLGVPRLAQVLNQTPDWLLSKADDVSLGTQANASKTTVNEDRREIKKLKSELRRLQKSQSHEDAHVLRDLLSTWDQASQEARLMAALFVTGNWSYKLKLWNRNVAVADDVLKAIAAANDDQRGA